MARARFLPPTLVGLGLIATLVALLAGYTRSALLDSASFGDRAVQTVRAEPVREAIATAFADALIERRPRLLAARPVLISSASSVLESRAAGGLISRGAVRVHRGLLTAEQPNILLDLADLSVLVQAYLASTGSDVSVDVGVPRGRLLESVAMSERSADVIRVAREVSWAAIIAPILALLAFGGALVLAPDRRRTLLQIGIGFMVVGALAATAYVLARGAALSGLAGDRSVVLAAALDAFLSDLLVWAAALGAAGALLAASAATLMGPVDASALPRAAWARISRRPPTPARRALRDTGLLVLGLVVVSQPLAALTLVAAGAGGYLAVLGLVGLLGGLAGPPTEDGSTVRPRRLPLAAAALALLLPVVAGVAVATGANPGAAPIVLGDPTKTDTCNGSVDLCDRRLDQVVFPSSHNAMGTAAAGFLNANHGASMLAQLDLGIRGLQIDALAGQRNSQGVVRTDLTGETEDTVVAQIGTEGLAAAQRLAGRVAFGPIDGDTDLYLCHVLCELGAVLAVPEFRSLAAWLERNPREVLMIFIQDEAERTMIVEALQESGLADQAATLEPGGPLPTLGDLIDQGRRVALFAERRAGPPAWYMDGFAFFQETPFANRSIAELESDASCRPNRGGTRGPLFQVNHWVESYPPNPIAADTVNQPAFLLDRARRCQRERGRLPNLLAVDFVERGDIVGAAATLNRRTPPR